MAFGTVDDRFYNHPKLLTIPRERRNEAAGLYFRAISYSNAQLTDGVITASLVEVLDGTEANLHDLLEAKLWHRRRDRRSYLIHNFLKEGRNRSRAEVLALRGARAEAGRKGGKKAGEGRAKGPTRAQNGGPEANPKQTGRTCSGSAEAKGKLARTRNPQPLPSPRGATRGFVDKLPHSGSDEPHEVEAAEPVGAR